MRSGTNPTPRPLSPVLRKLLLLLLVAALAGGGWLLWRTLRPAADEGERYVYATVEKGDIEDLVSATGSLQPREYVDVGAQLSGQVQKIHVAVGDRVKRGQLLAEIDATVLRSQVDASRAQLRNLRAQLAEREAQRSLAELQHRRQQRLMAEEATSAELLQEAEAGLRSARAQVEGVKAQIDQSLSGLRADEARLDYARIYAPMDGTVVSISARQGQTLNANQQAPVLLRIADLSTMTVQTQVSEADVGKLKPGMDAYFTTLGGQTRRWYGELRTIEPTPVVQNNVVLYNALFDVPNEHERLMTQMTAQVFFVVASARDVLLVPVSALKLDEARGRRRSQGDRQRTDKTSPGAQAAAGGAANGERRTSEAGRRRVRSGTVKVKRADGTLEERRVEIGISNRIQAQVLSGLQAGEQVVSGEKSDDKRQNTRASGGGMPGMGGMGGMGGGRMPR